VPWEERQREDEKGAGQPSRLGRSPTVVSYEYSPEGVSVRAADRIFSRKWRPPFGTTDTGLEVSYNDFVHARWWRPRAVRVVDTCRLPSGRRLAGPDGGVPVSTGWQEARIACRGWSAGHVKSRPSFNCRSSVFSGCL